MSNIILNTDSYKASHYLQYPENTKYISSYIEARGGDYTEHLFFGLQMFIKKYLLQALSKKDIQEAKEFFSKHGLPFHEEGWQYILDKHQGSLPLKIEAVGEGTVLPVKNVLVQVVNTDPKCAWLTGYLETAILRGIWYPTTVAAISWKCKQIIKQYLERTADNLDGLDFKLHDFGARGASSLETAGIGAAAHLVNFLGTDTITGVIACRDYYHEDMAGFSIPAAEHSTITSWGREHELDAYRNMLKQFSGESKLFAVVSDSYDLWHAIDELWGRELKQAVIDNGGTLVIRPDSGNPVEVVVKVLRRLIAHFGSETNTKGYKVLPKYLRVIQGDGISSPLVIEKILHAMEEAGLSADNLTFGMGGGLLQKLNRDTLSFAMKASAINIAGQWQDVYKAPVTDMSKQSKRGRLALIKMEQGFETILVNDLDQRHNLLETIYENGKLMRDLSLSEIRKQASLCCL